jgi:myosin heavy subunit
MIREYDILYNSYLSLFKYHENSSTPSASQNNPENELLVEIELKRNIIEEKNAKIEELTSENGYLQEEMIRFEELKNEFKKVNEFRDKEETNKITKMQDEILLLSQIKTDNSKTLANMEKETNELRQVLAKLSGEKSKEKFEIEEKMEKINKENERLNHMESGLKDKIKLLEDQLDIMKKQVKKMMKEKEKYHKKYNLMHTLNKGHETRINSIDKENKNLIEKNKEFKKQVNDLKESMKNLIQEVGTLGVKKEAIMDRMGHDARVAEQIEEADSLDDSLNETMNEQLKEIEMDFEGQEGFEELTANERENLEINETFEREIQLEEAHMKEVTGFGSNFIDDSQLDVTNDFLNMSLNGDSNHGIYTPRGNKTILKEEDLDDRMQGKVKVFDKEDEEELKKIYDKVSDSGSRKNRSRKKIRVQNSTRSINKEKAQKDFEKEIDAKIKKRQEEGLSRLYTSQFRSTVYDSSRKTGLLVSTLANTTPIHKSTFEFGIESRKVEMNLLKKTKETIGELCKSMNTNLLQGDELVKLEKGIKRIKKVDDLVEWVFVYFTKKLTKMEGAMKNLKSDQCK